MDHDLEDAAKHSAGNNMAQRVIQHRDISSKTTEHLHVSERILDLDFHHVVDKMLIAGTLRAAQEQLHRLPVGTDVVYHPVDAVAGLHPHVVRLLLFRQFGKGGLGLHERPISALA